VKYDPEFAKSEGDIFNNYLKSFRHFYGGDEPEETERTDIDIPTDSGIPLNSDSTN
jgi:hypothetical protein